MNGFSHKPAHGVLNWQAPASTRKKQPAVEESQVSAAGKGASGLGGGQLPLKSDEGQNLAPGVPQPVVMGH